jgi:hypothetical protein
MPETSGTLRASTSAKNFIFYGDSWRRKGKAGSQQLKDIWIPAYVDTKCLPTNGLLYSAPRPATTDRGTVSDAKAADWLLRHADRSAELGSARKICFKLSLILSIVEGKQIFVAYDFWQRGDARAATGPYYCAFSAHANGFPVMSVSIPNLNYRRLYRVHMVRIARPSSSFLLPIVTDRGRSCSRTWFRRA